MTGLSRYAIGELLKVFLVTLIGMTALMMIVGLAREAISQGLGPLPILRMVPYAVPNALRFAVPGTILFAACSVYGRMAAANEIVAVKSLGISPVRVVRPALVLAFLVSLVSVWLNDLAVSWGRDGIRRVVLQSGEQIAYGMLRTQRSYSCERFSINVQDVRQRRLIRPYISFRNGDGSPPTVITAEEAELRLNPRKGTLAVALKNGQVSVDGQVTMTFPDTITPEIPLQNAADGSGSSLSPSNLALCRIQPETVVCLQDAERERQEMAVVAAWQLLSGDFAALTGEAWSRRCDRLAGAEGRLHRLHTEPWRRWANGFSCLFFVMVGAPLAIRMRNADLWSSFAMCFLPILLVYYPLLAFGADRAKCGELHPSFVWLGNVMLAAAGLWLLRRTARH